MEAFQKITSIAIPLDRVNVDTDQIIPKQFLKKIERTGFGVHLFHDWRYLDDAGQTENPDFILNDPDRKNARILLARDNFGCGSSREHAPWALSDWGFRVMIAPSFADIFYNNSIKNGLLPVKLSEEEVDEIFEAVNKNPKLEISVDLENNLIKTAEGKKYSFNMDPFKRESLRKGLDDIGWTLQFEDAILAYESKDRHNHPWLWQ